MDECFCIPKALRDLVKYVAKIGMEPDVIEKITLL